MDLIIELEKHGLTLEKYENILKSISDKKEGLSDLDWSDIKDLYCLDLNKDSIRKMNDGIFGGYFVKKYEEYKKLHSNTSCDELFIQQLEEKKKELVLERKKVQAEKLELNRHDTYISRYEAYYENIANAITRIEPPVFNEVGVVSSEKAYVLQFSDVHYGAKFKTITNEYSRQICKERFEKMLYETINFVTENNVNELYIVNNADSLQGMLRMSDVKINDIAVVEALVEFQKMMAEFINKLSAYCYVKYYQVQTANHTELRLLNSQAGQMSNEDMEKIICNYLKDVLILNERVYVNTEFKEDNLQFKVLEYDVIALHGHTIRSQTTALKDKSNQYKKFFDYMLIGHFHNGMELTVGEKETHSLELLCSPSIVGTCPYADSLMVGGKSMCKIYTFESGKGHTDSKSIVLN